MEIANILIFGVAIVGIGILVLGAVIAEMRLKAPGAGVLMGVGLGMGVLAFSAKLGLIVAYLAFGDLYLAHYLNDRKMAESYVTQVDEASSRKGNPLTVGYEWRPLPEKPPIPRDNPMTAAKIALGKRLFNDVRLSANNSVSCASCHDINKKGGADGLQYSVGIFDQHGGRNAPTVLNAAFQSVLFWDGRAASLEEQAKGPIVNPLEMGMENHLAVVEKVNGIADYHDDFAKVFGGSSPVTIDNIAKAIAAYERTLITPSSPYDRFLRGDTKAMSTQQLRGMALFAEFGCVNCHRGPNFSDASLVGGAAPYRLFPSVEKTEYEERYHLAQDKGAVTGPDGSRGVWRIPSLRNVTRTAPYFHNGSVDDLREAVRVMARVQLDKPSSNSVADDWRVSWSPTYKHTDARPNAAISDSEVDDIVAFLHALEGDADSPYTIASTAVEEAGYH